MLLSGRRTKDEHAAFLKLQRYPHRVQLYRIPPIETIHLEEFEKLAIERLKRNTNDTNVIMRISQFYFSAERGGISWNQAQTRQ